MGYLQPPAIRKDARMVRIDADPIELNQGPGTHLPILGCPRTVLNQLAREITDREITAPTAWLEEARTRRDTFRQQCEAAPRTESLHALDIVRAVRTVLTDDTIFLVDGGNIGQWVHQCLCDRYPGHWLTCGISGVIGYGIPGAMAARALYPDRPIVLVSGDGSLTFTVAEFETAARQHLPFVAILADDQAWGISLTGHRQKYGKGISSELGPIRFDKMAEAFGARGVRIETPEQIVPAIQEGFSASVPTLIHVPVVRANPAEHM